MQHVVCAACFTLHTQEQVDDAASAFSSLGCSICCFTEGMAFNAIGIQWRSMQLIFMYILFHLLLPGAN